MTRVLLVDDDSFFRSMFLNLIDWEAFGCTIVASVANGQKAIDVLDSQKIDLLFTDMSMPVVDGLELIHYTTRNHPDVICVALSSYDDFHYVKDSLQGGATDYLLKHMLTAQGLEALLTKVLKSPARSVGPAALPEERFPTAAQQDFLSALLTGEYDAGTNIGNVFRELQLPALKPSLLLFLLDIHNYDAVKEKYLGINKFPQLLHNITSIMQSVLDRLGSGVVFVSNADGYIYAILTCGGFAQEALAFQTAALFTQQVSNSLKRYCNLDTTLLCSPICTDIHQIPSACNELRSQLGQPSPEPLPADDRVSAPAPSDTLSMPDGTHAVEARSERQERYSPYVYSAISTIHKRYGNSGLSLTAIAESLYVNASYLSKVFKRECGVGISDYLNKYRIAQAKESLLNSTLSVKQIAKNCGFENYNYFFRIFKKLTDLTPQEFRNQAFGSAPGGEPKP